MVINANALREAHRNKVKFDMEAFLTCVAEKLEKSYLGYVEIVLAEKTENWYDSPGFYNSKNDWITIYAPFTNKVLSELLVQGYNLYSQKGGTFVATLYQYPSNHFGGTIIYQADKTFIY